MTKNKYTSYFLAVASGITEAFPLADAAKENISSVDLASAWVSGVTVTAAIMLALQPSRSRNKPNAKGSEPNP